MKAMHFSSFGKFLALLSACILFIPRIGFCQNQYVDLSNRANNSKNSESSVVPENQPANSGSYQFSESETTQRSTKYDNEDRTDSESYVSRSRRLRRKRKVKIPHIEETEFAIYGSPFGF